MAIIKYTQCLLGKNTHNNPRITTMAWIPSKSAVKNKLVDLDMGGWGQKWIVLNTFGTKEVWEDTWGSCWG